MEIQRIIREYHKQLCAHNFDNLCEMDQFLERHDLPTLIQGERNDLNRPISIMEIESIINNLLKQNRRPDGSLVTQIQQCVKRGLEYGSSGRAPA
jgi:hypothetical protein